MNNSCQTNQELIDKNVFLTQKIQKLEQWEAKRNQVEEVLKNSQNMLETILQNMPGGSLLIDEDYKICQVNNRTCEITGYPEEELVGEFCDIICPKGAASNACPIWVGNLDCFNGMDTAVKCKDGRKNPILKNAQRITISGKNYILENFQDITELKHAEEALRELEVKQSSMIANISDVISIIDQDGTIKYKSPNVERWFGWHPQDLIGKRLWLTVHPDNLENLKKEFFMLLKKANSSITVEYQYKCKDGSYKDIELTATNLINDPSIAGVLLNCHDITQRKKAEKEQGKLQAQLTQAQKMESVGRLAGGVAHDFNNMLGVILGHADMLLEDLDTDLQIYPNLEEIKKAAQRSADLTKQLLAFARKQTVAPKVIDLNKAIESLLKMLQRLIGENIGLEWLPGKDIGSVKIDPSQIDQMLTNLCVNARDAIAGMGNVVIQTGTATFDENYCLEHAGYLPGEFVLLAVSDDGSGMNTELLTQVFEPFFTTKEQGKGTGLGLAMIYGVVKQNKGFVNVYSEPGKGTTFKIYLPRYIGNDRSLPEKGLAEVNLMGRETILLVEDEPAILKMTQLMLERLGYTVAAANTPSEAIHLAMKYAGQVQLLISDMVMPEMNGQDLAKKLLSSYPNLKLLFMSGYTADIIADHGVLDEGIHFISKPFSKKDLGEKVHEILTKE